MNKKRSESETLEILADPKMIKSLVRAEKDIKAGRLHSHKDVFGKKVNHNG
jgi:hypothetical protein